MQTSECCRKLQVTASIQQTLVYAHSDLLISHHLPSSLISHVYPQQKDSVLRGSSRNLQEIQNGCVDVNAPEVCRSASSKGTCKPYRTPDYCSNSFPTLIASRKTLYENDPSLVTDSGYWFHTLDSKLNGYMFTTSQNLRAPKIYFCSSSVADLETFNPNPITGFVVRATNLHSNKGTYVLPNGFGTIELLRGIPKTVAEVISELQALEATELIVEEYIAADPSSQALSTEYKIHAFDGTIGSISVVENRGTPCACYAEVDEAFNRLDQYGCFTRGGSTLSKKACVVKDFITGLAEANRMKGYNLCDRVAVPKACVLQDILSIAKTLSKAIGVYARIDLFVTNAGEVVVQEYTLNHANGTRHCSAKLEGECINSCFLGDMWINAGGNPAFGGPATPPPANYLAYANAVNNKCAAVANINPIVQYTSNCAIQQSNPGTDPANMRFSKVPNVNGVGGGRRKRRLQTGTPRLPLTAPDYPIVPADATWLRKTGAISVFLSDDCSPTECFITPQELFTTLGITVTHPSSDPSNPFWAELKEVIDVQLLRATNAPVPPLLKRVPAIWSTLTIAQVAEAVHDEFPGSIHVELIKGIFGGALDKP